MGKLLDTQKVDDGVIFSGDFLCSSPRIDTIRRSSGRGYWVKDNGRLSKKPERDVP